MQGNNLAFHLTKRMRFPVQRRITITKVITDRAQKYILSDIICLIILLVKVLKMENSKDKSEDYYQKTLNYFLFGVGISFVGVMVDMFAHL